MATHFVENLIMLLDDNDVPFALSRRTPTDNGGELLEIIAQGSLENELGRALKKEGVRVGAQIRGIRKSTLLENYKFLGMRQDMEVLKGRIDQRAARREDPPV